MENHESLKQYESTYSTIVNNKIALDPMTRRNLYFVIGMAYLRHGEIENCVQNHNHESCFIPIRGEGVHQLQVGSRKAIVQFETILKEFPDDLEAKYLLNLAYQTLGEYPDKVPAAWRIDPSWYTNKVKIKRFEDIAPILGINRNTRAGGVVMEDFTNDGWLDIVVTSWNHNDPTLFYLNNGDGTFSDKSAETGLIGHLGACISIKPTSTMMAGWICTSCGVHGI